MEEIANLIKIKIYNVRGIYVLVDRDLANIYGIETKRLLEQVKRNKERFPERYLFQMSKEEFEDWKSQNATSNSDKMGLRRPPYCFTEPACYMVSNIIKNKKAIETSILIMDAFVYMKHNLNENKDILSSKLLLLENKINDNTDKINELFLKYNLEDLKKEYIFFEGEIYDAYSLLIDILNKANDEIIIIDNYAGKQLLDILKNINKKIIIVSKNIDKVLEKKYESQYSNVKFINKDIFHDRFIIIDRKRLYSCGASFKDLGKKCFAINEIESSELLNILLSKIYTK